jgi:hypothetical protein
MSLVLDLGPIAFIDDEGKCRLSVGLGFDAPLSGALNRRTAWVSTRPFWGHATGGRRNRHRGGKSQGTQAVG